MPALARQFSAEALHSIDLPYRLSSWAVEDPENVALWFDDDGRLGAWAVIQTPWWTIDYVYDSTIDPQLHQEILGWADRRARTLQHPDYRPDLDLVVEAPDGRLVAFCICWFNESTLQGQLEPLGSHKDFRQFALGRVALSEGLRRLQSLGAQEILVETDNYRNTALRLYESFDFQVIQDVLVYRKDYGEPQN